MKQTLNMRQQLINLRYCHSSRS